MQLFSRVSKLKEIMNITKVQIVVYQFKKRRKKVKQTIK